MEIQHVQTQMVVPHTHALNATLAIKKVAQVSYLVTTWTQHSNTIIFKDYLECFHLYRHQ